LNGIVQCHLSEGRPVMIHIWFDFSAEEVRQSPAGAAKDPFIFAAD
jgi:hypothetical protein